MTQTLNYTIGADRRAFVKDIQNFKIDFADDNNNWVQARQFERGMRQVFVNILNEDHTPFDMTGCNVWFEGLLPENAKGDFRVIDDTGFVPIDLQNGQFRFDLPGHAFTVAGSYRQAFFRIVKNGQSVTTLEFDLQVLADKVIGGLVPRTYISPLEQILEEVEADFAEHTKKFDDINADFKVKVTNLFDQLSKQGTETANMLTTLQTRLGEIEEKIKAEGLFTQAEAEQFKQALLTAVVSTHPTFADLNTSDVKVGSTVKTLGYYAAGDGGGACYLISKNPSDYAARLSNGLYANLLTRGTPVNVLTLGVKRDDVENQNADIINNASSIGDLYFPAGKYYINDHLNITNNLIGEAIKSWPSSDKKSSNIVSKLTDGSLITLKGSDQQIFNMSVQMGGESIGIDDRSAGTLRINTVTVTHVGADQTGLAINHANVSRGLRIDDMSIWGEQKNGSVGINHVSSYDNRYNNIMVMGCQIGCRNLNGYADNCHIWCGGGADASYYTDTACLQYINRDCELMAGLMYLDSAHALISGTNTFGVVSIATLYAMWDGGAKKFLTDATLLDNPNLTLTIGGGMIKPNDAANKLLANVSNSGAIVQKGDADLLAKGAEALVPTAKNSIRSSYSTMIPGITQEFARIYVTNDWGGYCQLRFSNGPKTGLITIKGKLSDLSVKVLWDSEAMVTLRYKVEAGCVSLYTAESIRQDITVQVVDYSGMEPLIFDQMLFQNRHAWFGNNGVSGENLLYVDSFYSYKKIDIRCPFGEVTANKTSILDKMVHVNCEIELTKDINAYDQLITGLPSNDVDNYPTITDATNKKNIVGAQYKKTSVLQTTSQLANGTVLSISYAYLI